MGNKENDAPLFADIFHFAQTFLLESHVPDRENLVDDQNFRLWVGRANARRMNIPLEYLFTGVSK